MFMHLKLQYYFSHTSLQPYQLFNYRCVVTLIKLKYAWKQEEV